MASEADDLLKRLLDEVLEGRRALGDGIEGVRTRLESFRDETLGQLRRHPAPSRKRRVRDSGNIRRAVTPQRAVETDRPLRETLRVEIGRLKERLATLEKRLADLDDDSSRPQ